MSTNQENRHYAFKERHNPGGAAVVLEEDHLKAYLGGGATAGLTFNGTRLDWINKADPGTYTGLPEAMQAFAANQGFANWISIGGKNGDEGPIPLEGKCAVSESGLMVTVGFDIAIAGDATAGFTVYYETTPGSPVVTASVNAAGSSISGQATNISLEGSPIARRSRVWVDYNSTPGSIKRADSTPTAVSFWGQRIPNGSQQGEAFGAGFDEGFN